jgi:hypothetical protein
MNRLYVELLNAYTDFPNHFGFFLPLAGITTVKEVRESSFDIRATVAIIGISNHAGKPRKLYSMADNRETVVRETENINAYLVAGHNSSVEQTRIPLSSTSQMLFGNMPRDGGNLILNREERGRLLQEYPELDRFIRPYLGSEEMIQGKLRWCVWIDDHDSSFASKHPYLSGVLERVRQFRLASDAGSTRDFASRPYRFVQIAGTATKSTLAVAKVSSERRPYIPITLLSSDTIVSDLLFALYDAPLWNMALIASRLHLVWIATVCGKLKTDFRYSNTLGWNTFPVPTLTDKNKADLTRCAEDILLAREAHFPATIAELYDPENMPADLHRVHERNDEVLERIYIGRRFRNDTERLEKLFELYTRMAAGDSQNTGLRGKVRA